jgi:hypothetical protein
VQDDGSLGPLLAELRDGARTTQASLVLLSAQFGSLEATVGAAQASIAESAESQKAMVASLENKLTRELGSRIDSVVDTVTAVESRSNGTLRKLEQRITDLEVQLEAAAKKLDASPTHETRSVDFAADAVGARIDYKDTSPGLGRGYARQMAWAVSKIAGPGLFAPDGPYGWPAEVVLEKHLLITPGRCFSIGVTGNITIILPMKVKVDMVGIDHVYHNGIRSAPKDVRAVSGDLVLADWDVSEISSARVDPARTTDRITFEINSNHGAEFTCIYRVRVHGDPIPI